MTLNEREPAIILERTSGDEDEGQDVKAASVQTSHRADVMGFDVLEVHQEADVPGDTPWEKRAVLQLALREAREAGAVLVVREPSRLWRGDPATGRQLIEAVPDLEVLGRGHWSRRGGGWVRDDDTDELMRLIDLWDAWKEKRKVRERTGLAMDDLKTGRRKTRSGKPHHRPPWEPIPEALEAARVAFFDGASQREAVEVYRRASGFYDVRDENARKRRDAKRTVLVERLQALGPVGKPNRSERGSAPTSAAPDGQGSLAGQGAGLIHGAHSIGGGAGDA